MTSTPVKIETSAASAPSASYSQAIAWERLVATAGQVGTDPVTGALPDDFEDEVRQALANLRAVLEAAGSDMSSVLKTTCFLTDITTFATFDRIYREHFADPLPARSTVGIQLAGPLRFEIEALAVRAEQAGE